MIAGAAGPVASISGHQLLIFLLQVGLLLSLAIALGRLAMRFGWPAIVGELCTGVLAGPTVLGQLAPKFSYWLLPERPAQYHMLDSVGQIGVLLLVGIAGIQLDLDLVRSQWASAVKTGVAALLVPLAFGVGVAVVLPASLIPAGSDHGRAAVFVGVALGVSALPVIAKTLADMRLLHSETGQLILCAVCVDDTLGWLLVSVVAAMTADLSGLGVLAGAMVLLVVAMLAVRPLVRWALRAVAGRSEEGAVVGLVTTAILLAAAATQAIGLEAVFGAFACGVVISSCGGVDRTALAPLSVPVLSVLAPLYFATAGLRVDLTALARPSVLLAGLALLVVAVGGKFVGAYAGARLSRLGHWQALALGAGMNSRGVIEVVVATIGLQLGLLNVAMYTIIILIAIATSLMTPPLLRWAANRIDACPSDVARPSTHDRPRPGVPAQITALAEQRDQPGHIALQRRVPAAPSEADPDAHVRPAILAGKQPAV
jgi:Kef-type K+ transport system membrane component KefB